MNWYLKVISKYATFSGRACRAEYWYFVLFNFLISIGLGIVGGILDGILASGFFANFLNIIYSLGVLLPSFGVAIRRLHDTGRSGWWLLIGLVPLIGLIVLIVFFAQDSQPGSNQYGGNPKGAAAL